MGGPRNEHFPSCERCCARLRNGVLCFVSASWFLALLVALALPSGLSAQGTTVKIMPVGDSITRGSNYNGSVPGGYRRELGFLLASGGFRHDFVGNRTDNPAPGMDPNHNGLDGFRTDQMLTFLPTRLHTAPDIVLMHLGTNDLIQGVPLETIVSNLDALIELITQNAPGRRLFVATVIPIAQNRNGKTIAEWEAAISEYNTEVRNRVQFHANEGRNVTLVEMHDSLEYTSPNPAETFFQPGDGTHPGQAGYDQMAGVWFDALVAEGVLPAPAPGFILSVTSTPSYGVGLTVSPPDLDNVGSGFTSFTGRYGAGTAVTLTAPPTNGPLFFSRWRMDGADLSTSTEITITMNAHQSLTAVYVPGSEVLANGSFESDYDGWSHSGNHQIRANHSDYPPTDGSKLVSFNSGQSAPNGIISQTFETVPAQSYILSFDLGILDFNSNSQPQQVRVSLSGAGSPILTEELTITRETQSRIRWVPYAFNFVANSESTTLEFRDISSTTINIDLALDSVKVSGPPSQITPCGFNEHLPAFAPTIQGTPGNMKIRFATPAAGTYICEQSPDLIHWQHVQTIATDCHQVIEFDQLPSEPSPPASPAGRMFFRIGQLAP